MAKTSAEHGVSVNKSGLLFFERGFVEGLDRGIVGKPFLNETLELSVFRKLVVHYCLVGIELKVGVLLCNLDGIGIGKA